MRRTRRPERVVDRQRAGTGDVQFPAQFARIGHPERPEPVASHLDFLPGQPAEAGVGQVGIGAGPQYLARPGPIECQRRPLIRAQNDIHIFALAMLFQMIKQALFEKGGTDKIITYPAPGLTRGLFVPSIRPRRGVRGRAKVHDRGFKLDPATAVQEMGQGNPAHLLRQPVGHQPVQQNRRIRARNLNFGEGGNIHDTNGFSDGPNLGADHVMHHVSPKGIVILLRHAAPGKPARALMAINLFIHRTFVL